MILLFITAALAYLLIGERMLNRGMAYIRANALTDTQYLSMAVTDGRSASMTLPKMLFRLTWPLAVLAIVAVWVIAQFSGKDDMAAAH